MYQPTHRRRFLQDLGISAAALPFVQGLSSLHAQPADSPTRKRLLFVFSPNGTIPGEFWPDQEGKGWQAKRILKPLEPYRDRSLILQGICNQIGGDGDRHMRGMSCLLTGTELFPGNIQGGSHTPAGWASGISIDQEIKNHFQKSADTRTKFGSLEFGVAVPNRADPWTRMCYAGPNQPLAPIDDPRRIVEKLYGSAKDQANLQNIIDTVHEDLKRVIPKVSPADRSLLEQHISLVAEMEEELSQTDSDEKAERNHPVPEVDPSIELVNDNTPQISRMQIDLLVNAMANDMTRIASLQYMRSVGQARMEWLGISEGHHGLSHEPDKNLEAVEKLIQINEWFSGEIAYLIKKLESTPEPGRENESMLDHTLVVWLNELGKGNSHTLDNIPFVLIGGEKATGFDMGRFLKTPDKIAHNRLWLSVANAMGHPMKSFGTEKHCQGGALDLS